MGDLEMARLVVARAVARCRTEDGCRRRRRVWDSARHAGADQRSLVVQVRRKRPFGIFPFVTVIMLASAMT